MGIPVSPRSDSSAQESFTSLPQYGFGTELAFDKLVQNNPFLFRVYTPKAQSPFYDPTEPFFVGQKFAHDEQDDYFSIPVRAKGDSPESIASTSTSAGSSYADAARHLDWTTRNTSPYISTSFSFAWAVWEAARRYQNNVKHDVHIAVIDARALVGRAVTALSLLREGAPSERHKDHWKWYRFASEAQDVLVFGTIPGDAVLASMPLLKILDKLPSYFLRPDGKVDSAEKDSSLFSRLAWDHYTKPSFKQFSQDMSDQFSRLPAELRVRETTAGSVRLAAALLQDWYHQSVITDTEKVMSTIIELALVIAQWPAQWWVRERAADIRELVRGTAKLVVEEVKETRRVAALKEVERLQDVVADVERMATAYYKEEAPAQKPPRSIPPSSEPITTRPHPAQGPTRAPPQSKSRGIASTILAGVWFGTVLSLSVFSSPRWELANHLT
ncbi:hypothetical protein PUNSTDRAFT_96496 [Punctularia strigosozonata HHB-11173 SS5]|uniref:uncharacterized protein n=1 Tax=Punctularia strigosozonata (strain HHB-11173) TaxID=741275 RepID=UPI0004417AD4|nr:uncharacterized protein PUNSTDRAFT_96496 [Punctularia strigosozonata HHB-11173 SS5]EIN14544.1 hypothetical protein PUNSTDRAFT_96496 [Punctularia strigosozonata HHB-11173 SS5]